MMNRRRFLLFLGLAPAVIPAVVGGLAASPSPVQAIPPLQLYVRNAGKYAFGFTGFKAAREVEFRAARQLYLPFYINPRPFKLLGPEGLGISDWS